MVKSKEMMVLHDNSKRNLLHNVHNLELVTLYDFKLTFNFMLNFCIWVFCKPQIMVMGSNMTTNMQSCPVACDLCLTCHA